MATDKETARGTPVQVTFDATDLRDLDWVRDVLGLARAAAIRAAVRQLVAQTRTARDA